MTKRISIFRYGKIAIAPAILCTLFADTTIKDKDIGSGQTLDIVATGAIQTQNTVTIHNGGSSILWAQNQIKLEPGFTAQSGSSFVAAVDYDLNGISDQEEGADRNGDGIPDVTGMDSDGDGIPDAVELAAGLNPNNPSDVSAANIQIYQYDVTNKLTAGPGGSYKYDSEGNIDTP